MADMDIAWMTSQAANLVLSAVNLNGEECANVIEDVDLRYGEVGVYSLLCALAEAFAQMSGEAGKRDGNTWFGFEVEHVEDGPLNPEQVDADAQDVMSAMRFVTAVLNRDSAQSLALFDSARTPESQAALVAGLLKLVSASGRWRLDRPKENACG